MILQCLYYLNILSLIVIAFSCFFVVLHPRIKPKPIVTVMIGVFGIISVGALIDVQDVSLNPYFTVGSRLVMAMFCVWEVVYFIRRTHRPKI